MRDHRAGAERHGGTGVEMRTRADPPGALDDGDEAVIGMKMRSAEIIAGEPFGEHDIKAGL